MTPMLESRPGASSVRYQPDSSHFRVAVIGLGNAGHTLHLPALAAVAPAYEAARRTPAIGRVVRWGAPLLDLEASRPPDPVAP